MSNLRRNLLARVGRALLGGAVATIGSAAAADFPTGAAVLHKEPGRISVLDFGADQTGTLDSWPAIMSAIEQARSNGAKVYLPAGTYKITRSLNATFSGSPKHPIIIEGDGSTNTIINGVLTEAYPVLDFTNNKRGALKGVSIRSEEASLDTCALLLAESEPTGGSLITIEDCQLGTQSMTAQASVVAFCADQLRMSRAEVKASRGYGMVWGIQNIVGVQSKYQSIGAHGGDVTYGSFVACTFLGTRNAAFAFTGGDNCSFTDCYFGITGAGGPSIIDFANGGYLASLYMRGCRTENQSSHHSTSVFEIISRLTSASLEGAFSTDNAGSIFSGPGSINNVIFRGTIGPVVLFNNSGVISNSVFEYLGGLSSPIGVVRAAASCYNLTFSGRPTLASVKAVFGTIPGLNVLSETGPKYLSTSVGMLFPSPNAPTYFRPSVTGDCALMETRPYRGGTGLATVASYIFNPAVLSISPSRDVSLSRPFSEIELTGLIASHVRLGSTIKVQFTQGTNKLTALSASAVIGGSAGLKILIKLMPVSVDAFFCEAALYAAPSGGGAPYAAATHLSHTPFDTAGIKLGGDNIQINLMIDSADDDPLYGMTTTVRV